MNSRRTAKVAQAIRECVSSTILFGLKDPRVRDVTVLDVEVSGDIRNAKVYVSVMGDETAQSLCLHGLNSARGFLQSKVADRIQTRYTPILKFVLDRGVKTSIETSRVLREVGAGEALTTAAASNVSVDVDDTTTSETPEQDELTSISTETERDE
jgi:ribosome-binding factor A